MTLRSYIKLVSLVVFTTLTMLLVGCQSNGWMADPSAQGYYKPTPTTIPILDRIDIIEEPSDWPKLSAVTPDDLMPSDLTYKIAAGDILDVSIYGLYGQGQHFPVQRVVDQGGYFRVPEVGDVLVAGLTAQGAQDLIITELASTVMTNPSVQVSVASQTGFTYTIYGGLAQWGVFTLRDPNLLLLEAISQAGGIPQSIRHIYVIRQLPVSQDVLPTWDRDSSHQGTSVVPTKPLTPVTPQPPTPSTSPSKSIEDLIKELNIGSNPAEHSSSEVTSEEEVELPTVAPGIIQTGNQELVDIDDLLPSTNSRNGRLPVDIDDITAPSNEQLDPTATFIYVSESDSWVPVSSDSSTRVQQERPEDDYVPSPSMLERTIVIPWERLRRGDSSYNIVVRPEDRIYVEPPPLGNLYIRGEIARPGVFDYPATGEKITLSQFITAAGDLGPIAVPEKVSLTRRIGDNLEATVTLNFAAILQKTEPDIFLKPNDHISVGTSWGATPMAIIRNGFRSTYGFGFLLDRNFGSDVFGAPPR